MSNIVIAATAIYALSRLSVRETSESSEDDDGEILSVNFDKEVTQTTAESSITHPVSTPDEIAQVDPNSYFIETFAREYDTSGESYISEGYIP